MRNKKWRRGSAMVEFVIAGITGITLMISTIQIGLAMWKYHSLAQAVHETNRYIASHGRSCTTNGNTCGITVGDIATKLGSYAIAIPSSDLNMTLTSQSGTTMACNPISAYQSDTTQWPPSTSFDNAPGNYTTVTASTTLRSAIVALWYGTSGQRIGSITLRSTSSVPIVF
jgi:Flp pilus assembly protein TadG